ncbi:rhodanese-like domain-containing protein [Lysinibacillus irui]|uniref:Rhodanese-like domain-containing protein n=1 Tax=Lysinibacillus irui TaxID=2998077 RepID=A0AAJ5RJR9_9BACI|nr:MULTISPECIES: rhodanese-like domain-containing protein [Lysinibacillus]MEA0552582.1 rhodanese-like domain-containing protein [Lysinibacillus irui]MEA0562961.1 rhodanese-like domain-containing protein [Lysinibacillus irui]MEA0978534.1 rhodanese-like domain-containing protein [Lysinibacillus irui]MEA1044688.1 rhodanese-like domain-containing protein [Lysinibacillus irui]WDV06593.1 rhodanese-like domain-containing protein [Lysinibacillus irui]
MKEITANEVQHLIDQGKKLNLIDVREVDEVQAGHIPDVMHIPLGLLEFRLHELNKNESYIMVCRSGARSGRATQLLEDNGFDASNMAGGMLAWEGKVQI